MNLRKNYEEVRESNKSLPQKTFYFHAFSEAIISSIKIRYHYAYSDEIFAISSILDPNYGFTWIPINERKFWKDRLKELSEKMDDNKNISDLANRYSISDWTINYDKETENCATNFEYDTMMSNFLESQKQAILVAKRINDQRKVKLASVYVDPLLFWKINESKFLQLSRVARSLFGIPVTSVYAERNFSKLGFIVRPHRRCLADDLAENLFFCKENLNFL